MKTYYLIHETTKEHVLCKPGKPLQCIGYKTVEADSEGWIKHEGDECPLPLDARLEVRYASGHKIYNTWPAGMLRWRDVKSYRPLLEPEKAQEPEPVVKESFTTGLLDRLKAAHESAQTIPDLEAELRRELAGMGYDLVYRNPFFETEETAQRGEV